MTKVQLAMHFDVRAGDFYGSSKFFYPTEHFNRDLSYITAEINLDDTTTRAIELTKPIWGQTRELPPVILDGGGHGENRGIVIERGLHKGEKVEGLSEFDQYDLRTRVSVGAAKAQEGEYDLTKPTRHHMSVWAGRQFFPIDYKELGLDEDIPIVEIINYSLRWLNGKFDDWSNSDEWVKGITKLDEKYRHEMRTTYAFSYPDTVSQEYSTQEGNKEAIKELRKRVGRRERAFPLTPKNPKEQYDMRGRIPIIGYDAVEEILNEWGLWSSKGRQTDNPNKGIEFLFNDVLHAMENFAKSAGGKE